MNNLKSVGVLITLLIFSACKDDEIKPSNSASTNKTDHKTSSLIGKWNAFEILGVDGRTYGLNMFIPKPDSSLVPGCGVLNYQESYLEYSFNFSADSSIEFVYKSTDQDRLYTIIDSAACQFAYQAWFTSHYIDTSIFTYIEIPESKIIVWEQDSLHKKDTIVYTLTNGVLKLDNQPNFKFEL